MKTQSFAAPEGKYVLDFELNCETERNLKDQKPSRTCILNNPKVDFFDTKKFSFSVIVDLRIQ